MNTFDEFLRSFNMSDQDNNIHATGVNVGPGGSIFREGATAARVVGRPSPVGQMGALFNGIDTVGATRRPVPVSASCDSVMTPVQANANFLRLLQRNELHKESPGAQMGFMEGMGWCMILNGTSGLSPGRAEFSVAGTTFNYRQTVADVLGDDHRRFARAYADYLRRLIRENTKAYQIGQAEGADPDDFAQVRWRHENIQRIAAERSITRATDLCFDVAEYCTGLTLYEKQLVSNSKQSVIASGVNSIDNPRIARAPVQRDNPGPLRHPEGVGNLGGVGGGMPAYMS